MPFFPLSASNKLLQITPHCSPYCSDKSLKQHSKILESVDSRSLTFWIEIRTENSLKSNNYLEYKTKKKTPTMEIWKGNLKLMETLLEIFTLSPYCIFATRLVLWPHTRQPPWLMNLSSAYLLQQPHVLGSGSAPWGEVGAVRWLQGKPLLMVFLPSWAWGRWRLASGWDSVGNARASVCSGLGSVPKTICWRHPLICYSPRVVGAHQTFFSMETQLDTTSSQLRCLNPSTLLLCFS